MYKFSRPLVFALLNFQIFVVVVALPLGIYWGGYGACHSAQMEVRGQLVGIGSLLPPRGFGN